MTIRALSSDHLNAMSDDAGIRDRCEEGDLTDSQPTTSEFQIVDDAFFPRRRRGGVWRGGWKSS